MFKDISGVKFGLLTAVELTGEKRWGARLWRCTCECGNSHVAAVNSLCQGLVRSCGCLRRVSARARPGSHGLGKTSTYKSWDAMVQRCTNKNNPNYKDYGAVGVEVCERWRSFVNFFADMGHRPAGTSLGRVDPFGDYGPSNCRWSTAYEQAHNKRMSVTSFEQAEDIRRRRANGEGPKSIVASTGRSKGSVNGIIYLGNVGRSC